MEELRIVTVHMLSDLANGFLEVKGQMVIRQARRLSGYANHPDPMLELDRAALRFHQRDQQDLWEEVEAISLNRERLLLIVPLDDGAAAEVKPPESDHQVRVKLICRGLIVTGFVAVRANSTVSALIHETPDRFIAVRQARIMAPPGAPDLQAFPDLLAFCLVNRAYIAACIETRPQLPQATPVAPDRESV
jgi:hypothetical protein